MHKNSINAAQIGIKFRNKNKYLCKYAVVLLEGFFRVVNNNFIIIFTLKDSRLIVAFEIIPSK